MIKLIPVYLLAVALVGSPAFARSLGNLDTENQPQNLVSASEFLNELNSPTVDVNAADATSDQLLPDNVSPNDEAVRGRHWRHGRHHHHRHHRHHHRHHHRFWPSVTSAADRADTPVTCFASDAAGNWYASSDAVSNVSQTQELANHECLVSGGSCSQNLGCTFADEEEDEGEED